MLQESRNLGLMLYDMDFTDMKSPMPMFFEARMDKGVINVPDKESKEVLR